MDEEHKIYFSCQEYLEKIGHPELILLSKIQAVWEEVVGENINKNVFPVKIIEDTLLVSISNPAWDTQVNFFAKDILSKLRKRIDEYGVPPNTAADSRMSEHVKTDQSTFPLRMKTFLKH